MISILHLNVYHRNRKHDKDNTKPQKNKSAKQNDTQKHFWSLRTIYIYVCVTDTNTHVFSLSFTHIYEYFWMPKHYLPLTDTDTHALSLSVRALKGFIDTVMCKDTLCSRLSYPVMFVTRVTVASLSVYSCLSLEEEEHTCLGGSWQGPPNDCFGQQQVLHRTSQVLCGDFPERPKPLFFSL